MEKPIILCDLDGTLADLSHRIHHIRKKPKDWRTFFAACHADEPIRHVLLLLALIDRASVEVWITSGRSEECRRQTEEWLAKHQVRYNRLIMRKEGDFTDDQILKPSWLEDGTIPKERVMLAIDDRDRVVKGWRAAGIPCLQCAEGDF